MRTGKLLTLFGLRDIEINLYETLLISGTVGATELAKRAGLSRTAVYDLLERLLKTGLVTQTTKGGVKMFAVQPPEKLELLMNEKENDLFEAKEQISKIRDLYNAASSSLKPRLQMFEGKKELQQMMKDMLLHKDIEVSAYWPLKKIITLLGTDFLADFHKKRVAQNIELKVIWPANQIPKIKSRKYSFLETGSRFKREARVAPAGLDFSLGYSIYDNTVRFISSSKENFGFLVESPELSEMLRKQFNVFWELSKSVKR